MDYEQKYKKAFEKIKQGLAPKDGCEISGVTRGFLEEVFPELKESENEKTKRILLSISNKMAMHLSDIFTEEEFQCYDAWSNDWLEKQGEKPVNDTDEDIVEAVKDTSILDMVEPKFKVGDWIVQKDLGAYKIVEICESWYEVISYKDGIQYSIGFDKENDCHLWTIQDAKDGDVLVGSKRGVILMFRGIGNTEWDDVIDYHCYYDCYREDFIVQKDLNYWGNTENNQLEPATKEQRELLFQKMKEAGYEWDGEKKELKKIEQKSDIEMKTPEESLGIDSETYNKIVDECIYGEQNPINEDADPRHPEQSKEDVPMSYGKELDAKMLDACARYFSNDDNTLSLAGVFYAGVEAQKEIGQKNVEWSEEDSQTIQRIIDFILYYRKYNRKGDTDTIYQQEKDINWLKSLKPQSHWKPSEEQIAALEWQVYSTYEGSWQYNASKELLEQLKQFVS